MFALAERLIGRKREVNLQPQGSEAVTNTPDIIASTPRLATFLDGGIALTTPVVQLKEAVDESGITVMERVVEIGYKTQEDVDGEKVRIPIIVTEFEVAETRNWLTNYRDHHFTLWKTMLTQNRTHELPNDVIISLRLSTIEDYLKRNPPQRVLFQS